MKKLIGFLCAALVLGCGAAPVDSQTVTTISTCGAITAPGSYILDRDLSTAQSSACLNIHDTHDVYLDCKNFTIKRSASSGDVVKISNVTGFSVKYCQIDAATTIDGSIYSGGMSAENSSNGEITDNKSSDIGVTRGSYVNILRNIVNGSISFAFVTHSRIEDNTSTMETLSGTARYSWGNIGSSYGSYNTFKNNVLDGKANTVSDKIGADDGIILGTESHSVVSGNKISNHWDCSIETTGFISDVTFSNNTMKGATICGIGAWIYNSFLGNTITGNTLDDSPALFLFYRTNGYRNEISYDGLVVRPADPHTIYFKDNVFENNVLTNYRDNGRSATQVSMLNPVATANAASGDIQPVASDYVLTNNLFKDNDFGYFESPVVAFTPRTAFVDGGGNRCFYRVSDNYAENGLRCMSYHTTDSDHDWRISLSELTRAIEIYNYKSGSTRTGEYHIEFGTEDGYGAGPGSHSGYFNSADTNRDWKISLLELTRIVELYNAKSGTSRTGQYRLKSGTEEGYEAVYSGATPISRAALDAQVQALLGGGEPKLTHSTDENDDWQISLGELLRVIELYNSPTAANRTGDYHVEFGTEDNFAVGLGSHDGPYYSADTDHNWKISLPELTRVVELFNARNGTSRTGLYRVSSSTVDGFEPVYVNAVPVSKSALDNQVQAMLGTGDSGGGTGGSSTSIESVKNTATLGGGYADGWVWVFHLTVPSAETSLQMKFNDWTCCNGAGKIPVANNMRISSVQATPSTAVTLTAPGQYSAALNLTGDLSPTTADRQVDVKIEVQVPTGTVKGSYGTSYGLKTI